MQTRNFLDADGTKREISVLGLGCSRVGSIGNLSPMGQVRATIAVALDLGVTVFDTADIYGQGDSERELGRALRGQRERAFVVTKLGRLFSAKMQLVRPLKPLLRPLIGARMRTAVVGQRSANLRQDFNPGRFAPALEASLRRMRFEAVDGLLLHSPPASVVRRPETAEALQTLRSSGKTLNFGVSCDDRVCLEAALKMPGLTLLQLSLDLIDELDRDGLGAEVRKRGLALFARESIRHSPSLTPPRAVAAAAARPAVTCVIAGASHPDRLRALCEAVA